ncbi:MAG TPA: hypothetical protein PK777_08815, partial [Thermoguttaceae bacterium]|nr:hypothetical protein [Thermoguttaceae bacterium]
MDLVWLLYGRTETKQPTAPALAQEAIALPPEASAIGPPEADSLVLKNNLPEDSEERQKASEVSLEASGPTEACLPSGNEPTEAETPIEAHTRPAASPAQAAAQPSRF